MTIENACQVTLKELKKSGYPFKEIKSKSTDSVYYEIHSATEKLLFRIANHKTDKNIITFRVDHKSDNKNLLQFIHNRIKDLSYRSTKRLLGL